MLNKKAVSPVFGSLMMVLAIIGCSDDSRFSDDLRFDYNPLERVRRIEGEIKPGKDITIAEMTPDDAIVLINGYPLTKKAFDSALVKYAAKIGQQKDMNPLLQDKMVENFRRGYVKRFVAQRLMVDAAFDLQVVTTNDVVQFLRTSFDAEAKRRGKSVKQLVSSYKGDFRAMCYELAVEFVMDRLITKKIPPKAEVTEEFVKATQDQVAQENKIAADTNAFISAQMKQWRKGILEGKFDFGVVADRCAGVADAKERTGGLWGDFEEGAMEDPLIEAKVFAMKKGQISDVLEDENGYQIVKVLDIVPPKRDDDGRILQREIRKLARIYVEKLPYLIVEQPKELTSDLKMQMQMQAINEYVTDLLTNGTNRVVYPHGENFGF